MGIEVTRISSKGQIVLPLEIRKNFNLGEGEILSVSTKDNLIVLKKVDASLSKEEIETFKEIKQAWKDIDEGRCKTMNSKDFLKEIEEW